MRRAIHIIILLVHKLWHEEKPRFVPKLFGGNVGHELFHVIAAVGWVGHQDVERWITFGRCPRLVAIFFTVVNVWKPKRLKVFSDSSVAIVGIIDGYIRAT